jgi:predicted outer membrane repeat protein
MRTRSISVLVLVAVSIAAAAPVEAAVWFVDGSKPVSGDGTSWHEAVRTIEEGVALAAFTDQIWIKAGVYNLASAISLVDRDYRIYGGFAGDENTLAERDWVSNEVVINGSALSVPCFSIEAASPIIDGVRITGCHGEPSFGDGGAMEIRECWSEIPQIRNVVFNSNGSHDLSEGGAIYSYNSQPVITNCSFWSNAGGVYGGAVAFTGAGAPIITNCTFSLNEAVNGGALSSHQLGGNTPTPTVTNSILWGNTATGQDHQLYGNYGAVTHNDIDQSGYTGNGNIRQDPLLFGSVRPHLREGSPCIDAGNNSAFQIPSVDFDGDPRIIDGDGNGTATVDMGADEFVPGAAFGVWYVDGSVGSSGLGTSWGEALRTIGEAASAALDGDEIWIKGGNYVLSSSILVDDEIGVFGGFAGWETQRDQRDPAANPTTIQGDGSPLQFFEVTADDVIFDGLTFTGSAFNSVIWLSGPPADTTINECTFTGISGIPLIQGLTEETEITSCRFIGNGIPLATDNDFTGTAPPMSISDCLFLDNTSGFDGAAFRPRRAVNLDRCVFLNNQADGSGGAIYLQGPWPVRISNSLFVANAAGASGATNRHGGAIAVYDFVDLVVTNCTFYGNTAGTGALGGGAIGANMPSIPYGVVNSQFWNNAGNPWDRDFYGSPTVSYSNIQQTTVSGTGVITIEPAFVDPDGADDILGTPDDDLRLAAGSAGIDVGDNAVQDVCAKDLDGLQRFLDDPAVTNGGSGTAPIIDMGAYERGGAADTYDLTMAVVEGGSTVPAVGVHSFPVCATIPVEAIADPGWAFVEWTGDVADPTSAATSVEMLADRSATALFLDMSIFIFDDGFESGDTTAWTSTTP